MVSWTFALIYLPFPLFPLVTDSSRTSVPEYDGGDAISLKAVDDCRMRLDKVTRIFEDTETEAQDTAQMKTQMLSLKKLLIKELKTLWDLTTLERYLQKYMIPRGLRLRKLPTFIYDSDFLTKWNLILSDCSKSLMSLIVPQESQLLSDLRVEIKQVQDNVALYAGSKAFIQMDNKFKDNLAKLETNIMDTKQ